MIQAKPQFYLYIFMFVMSAFAHGALPTPQMSTQANPLVSIEKAPEPIKRVPTYSYWKKSWDQAQAAQATALNGAWKAIARATTQTCYYEFVDAYNEIGLKNRDGSLEQLAFGEYPGPRGEKIFGVRALNLGSNIADQGPFSVEATEPQFSLWGYLDGEVTHRVYYEQSCRLDTAGDLLICMADLNLLEPAPGQIWAPETQACAADPFAHVLAYKRIDKKPL